VIGVARFAEYSACTLGDRVAAEYNAFFDTFGNVGGFLPS
jgi:hypothetical protein